MKRFLLDKKIKILLLIFLNLGFSFSMTYAYWAFEISGSLDDDSVNLSIGEFPIAISTPEQFYEFATNPNSSATDHYYIKNDLDFTSFDWTYDASNNDIVIRGILDGNNKTISNLTLKNYSDTYLYFGIFPIINNFTLSNLKLQDVNLELNATSLSGSSISAGLIAGEVNGGVLSTLTNITIIDSGVRGTSGLGVGGLIGRVNNNNTELHLLNIKATNLKVFSTTRNVGGLIGRINNNTPVSVIDVDIQGEVYSHNNNGYTGGIVGFIINNNSPILIKNAIVEMGSQNTLETDPTYYLLYSTRYRGGFIGWHQRTGALTTIENAIYMGSLYINLNTIRRLDVGTVTGRADAGEIPTIIETYYSFVSFRSSSGTVIYTPDGTPTGQMSTVVVADNYPGNTWWDSFFSLISTDNLFWKQDPITNRPVLEF